MTSGSHFLICSPLACYPWRQQTDLSEFRVFFHLKMPNNKEWNERDEISLTYIEALAKLFSCFFKCSVIQPYRCLRYTKWKISLCCNLYKQV